MESKYKYSLCKKKAENYNSVEILTEFHTRAKLTIEVLTKNMILSEMSLDRIFESYSEIIRENVIKLLLRCVKMYDARVDVKKILI